VLLPLERTECLLKVIQGDVKIHFTVISTMTERDMSIVAFKVTLCDVHFIYRLLFNLCFLAVFIGSHNLASTGQNSCVLPVYISG